MSVIQSDKTIENTTFSDIDMEKESVSDSTFHKCIFISCIFDETTINNCNFENCEFRNCELTAFKPNGCWLDECLFENCRVMGVDFSLLRSKLPHTIQFAKCKLDFSTFGNNEFQGSTFRECSIKEASFVGGNFKGSIFENCDLLLTRFEQVNLEKVDFTSSFNYLFDPSKNNCKGAQFTLPEAANLLHAFGIKVENNEE